MPVDSPHQFLSFSDILAGRAGTVEQSAARRWEDLGRPRPARPREVPLGRGFDTRVVPPGKQEHKRKRDASSERNPPAGPSTKPSTSQPQGAVGPKAAARPANRPPTTAPQHDNLHSRAALVGHGDVAGMFARRKARGAGSADSPTPEPATEPAVAAPSAAAPLPAAAAAPAVVPAARRPSAAALAVAIATAARASNLLIPKVCADCPGSLAVRLSTTLSLSLSLCSRRCNNNSRGNSSSASSRLPPGPRARKDRPAASSSR